MHSEASAQLTLRAGIGFLAFVVLASSGWDFVVSIEHLQRLFPWRLLGAGLLLGVLVGSYLVPQLRMWWAGAAAGVAAGALCTGAVILPHGFAYGIGGVSIVAVAVAVVSPDTRSALLMTLGGFLGAAVTLGVAGVSIYFLFSLAFFAVPAFAAAIAHAAASGMRARRTQDRDRELERLRDDLDRFGRTDELTGVPDKKQIDRLARREMALARRRGVPFSMIKIDIEGLERINAAHGRKVGDEALRAIASMCQAALRETDVLSRIAGDEFAAVAMDADAEGAAALCTRLRERIQRAPLLAGDQLLQVSVNVGSATLGEADKSVDDLLERAERALQEGRAAPTGNGAGDGATA